LRRRGEKGLRRYAVETPLGVMTASWTDAGLAGLSFARGRASPLLDGREGRRGVRLLEELERYFRTGSARFRTPLNLSGGTDFEQAVWRALLKIPAGEVRTYGEVALAVGHPRATRAVGKACGRNPVAVLVPCHRVVAKEGLGGFGAGVHLKRRLLELEGVHVPA
jgi:methylated-DNA-[protein]-cysteine S-methyltransferase